MRRKPSLSLLWTDPEVEDLGENNLSKCRIVLFGVCIWEGLTVTVRLAHQEKWDLQNILFTRRKHPSSVVNTRKHCVLMSSIYQVQQCPGSALYLLACHSCSILAGITSEKSLSSSFLNAKMISTSLIFFYLGITAEVCPTGKARLDRACRWHCSSLPGGNHGYSSRAVCSLAEAWCGWSRLRPAVDH